MGCIESTISSKAEMTPTIKDGEYEGYVGVAWKKLEQLSQIHLETRILMCHHNKLTFLPSLVHLSQLVELDCSYNQITQLPLLPLSIKRLNCERNRLTSLPSLVHLTQLVELDCNYNLIEQFPPLPPSIKRLDCGVNCLKALPSLPASLEVLNCEGNSLTKLPDLSNCKQLRVLNCNCNNLSFLPPHLNRECMVNFYGNANIMDAFFSFLQFESRRESERYYRYLAFYQIPAHIIIDALANVGEKNISREVSITFSSN